MPRPWKWEKHVRRKIAKAHMAPPAFSLENFLEWRTCFCWMLCSLYQVVLQSEPSCLIQLQNCQLLRLGLPHMQASTLLLWTYEYTGYQACFSDKAQEVDTKCRFLGHFSASSRPMSLPHEDAPASCIPETVPLCSTVAWLETTTRGDSPAHHKIFECTYKARNSNILYKFSNKSAGRYSIR